MQTARHLAESVFALALLAGIGLSTSARAATIVVTDAGDPGNGVCDSVCTLREAITQANGTAIADTINFAIPTPLKTEILIAPATALPTITKPLTINGYSQTFTSVNTLASGTDAKLRIRLDGTNVGSSLFGLTICANAVNIKGLSITNFAGGAISYGRTTVSSQCVDPITSGTVSGNFIGLRSDGTTAAGNGGGVLVLNAVVTIGGAEVDKRNVISSNGQNGVRVGNVGSSGTSIQGNLIGTDRSAALDRGNTGAGIQVESLAGPVAIGDQSPNVVAYNTRGIGMSSSPTAGVSWYANRVFANDELGLDLGTVGITPNDPGGGDADTGPNDQQNFPEINGAIRVATGLSITGKLEVSNLPINPRNYRLAFYASASCDGAGNGEGERYLGSVTRVLSTATETFTIDPFATDDPLPPGTVLTATATDPNGSSSEFSACFPLEPPPLVVNSAADTNDGTCNAANCTLREAINAANTRVGPDVISFDIPVAGVLVITPGSTFPTITDTVSIDGYTQSDAAANTLVEGDDAVIRIRIDGTNAGVSSSGLAICGNDSVVRGLSITAFKQFGIAVGSTNTGAQCANTIRKVAVAGNFIGLQPSGTSTGNVVGGVSIRHDDSTLLGGSTPADRNVISANGGVGVEFIATATSTQVFGNYIGTAPNGIDDRGNNGAGLSVGTGANKMSIGAGNPNRLAFNQTGIRVQADVQTGVSYFQNEFRSNDGLGIDLGPAGVTNNDANDVDGVANFPELTLAERSAGGIRVAGTLDVPLSLPAGSTSIAVYASASCDGSGHGEGERFLGQQLVSITNASEAFNFDLATDDPLPEPTQITVTASAPGKITSEFSTCLAATTASTALVVTSAADTDGTTCGATCTLRQAINAANLQLGENSIGFNIPGGGVRTISPATSLPTITDTVSIDGYTQPGASDNALDEGDDAVILIRLDGASAGGDAYGLAICGSDSVVRGLSITGFDNFGVAVGLDNSGSACAVTPASVEIAGDFVGLAPDGAAAGNAQGGVLVSNVPGARIGGEEAGARNVISSNGNAGVFVSGAAGGRAIGNNYIGLDPNGIADRGNANAGVLLGTAANAVLVGTLGSPNRIGFNSAGVLVTSGAGVGNALLADEYVSNDGLGIDLGSGGVTANDTDDADAGANDLQNFPVITAVRPGSKGIEIDVTLDVPAATTNAFYTFAYYESATCDASGHGEGEIFMTRDVTTLSGGSESYTAGIKITPPPAGHVITATATNPGGSTSEFSACFTVPVIEAVFSDSFEDTVPEI